MTARDALRKGDWLGEYEIRSRMRAGGMATLFLAQRHGAAGVSRAVVIKVIHPHLAEDEQMVRMFIDEARISSHIRHSNVVYVEKFGEHEGLYYMVMEYVDGCSLLQVIRACAADGRKLSTAIAVHIAIEVAAGLHAAHETADDDGAPLGVVHRDVSPSNVLLTRDGRIKVIDFGIAKAHGRLGATRSGSGIKGKLCYMSPEQAWGGPVDRRIDIYALGICLWELLTTRQLFCAESDLALLELVRDPSIPPASTLHREVSAALDAVMARATARRPDDRHSTAFDLRRDLMAAVPGAVAVPPEMIGELVRHVCERERKTAQLSAPQPPPADHELVPVPAETSVRSAAGEIQPRPWRNRGLLAASFLGACAIGALVAIAIASSGSNAASTTPAQALQAPAPPTAATASSAAAPASDATRPQPASTASASDATRVPSASAASASDATRTQPASAASGSDSTRVPSASTASASDATRTQPASTASASDATRAPSASTASASDATRAQPASAASGSDATRVPSASTASASDATRTQPASAASGSDATRARAAASSASANAANPTAAGKPPRRAVAAPRTDKSRVTTIEVDGAVLADEAPPQQQPQAPIKPAKAKARPANAVRAGDAVLAE